MASPSMTFGAAAGALPSSSQSASATRNFTVDLSSVFEGQVSIKCVFVSVSSTSGIKVEAFCQADSAPTFATVASYTIVVPSQASTTNIATLYLPGGKWKVILTNLDASNAVTTSASLNTLDSIA